MNSKKVGLPRQTLPPILDWILKNASSEQLEFLVSMKEHHQFKSFQKLIEGFKFYCMEEVFKSPVKSAEALSDFRAMKIGEFSAFIAILGAINNASFEIKRRRDIKY